MSAQVVTTASFTPAPRDSLAPGGLRSYSSVYLRLALAAGFLTALTDRFGLWGPAGTTNVAWGNFEKFTAYTAQLNPWAPAALAPALAWAATVAESVLAVLLLLGLWTRWTGVASGVLLLLFALGMTAGTGVKSALNASVFTASAAAFALAASDSRLWSLDALRGRGDRRKIVRLAAH